MTEHPTRQLWRRGDPEPPQGIDVLWDPDPMAQGAEATYVGLRTGRGNGSRARLTGPVRA
jgi:hypothetical protein